jgi:CHAD domain-containing protein
LRSALSLFGDTLPEENREFFPAELRWLSGELGDARDLDVFLAETLDPMLLQTPDRDDLHRLAEVAREMREVAYRRVCTALDSRRYTGLLLALGAWNAGRRWRNQPLTPESARLFAPARETGRELLDRLYDKARRRGSRVGELTLDEAHRLRIALKKLRYAGEFLSRLYPHRHARRFVRRLRRLQETLGHLNDQTTAHSLLERVIAQGAPAAAPDHQWAAGYVSGWTSRVAREKLRPLEKDWKDFSKQDPFWRFE